MEILANNEFDRLRNEIPIILYDAQKARAQAQAKANGANNASPEK